MCRKFGSVFLKEIPKHGSHLKSLSMGLFFKIFRGSLENFVKIAENEYLFSEKSLNMGTLFLENLHLNMGMGPELPAAHPRPIQI